MDGYTQTKVESEQLALRYQRDEKVPIVVLRPGFIYGPRDRTVLPKLIENLRNGMVRYLGSGKQALNTIYVGNLVDAILLALTKPGIEGQIFNLTDGEAVSKRRFIETVADGAGAPRPKGKVPLWVARLAAWWMERSARTARRSAAAALDTGPTQVPRPQPRFQHCEGSPRPGLSAAFHLRRGHARDGSLAEGEHVESQQLLLFSRPSRTGAVP